MVGGQSILTLLHCAVPAVLSWLEPMCVLCIVIHGPASLSGLLSPPPPYDPCPAEGKRLNGMQRRSTVLRHGTARQDRLSASSRTWKSGPPGDPMTKSHRSALSLSVRRSRPATATVA